MQKHVLFYVSALFSVAMFMTAGCATQDVVKKDEGIVPAAVAKQTDHQTSDATSPKQAAATSVPQATPAQMPVPDKQAQKTSAKAQLQSALQKIYFDFDSSDLSESARTTLVKNAAALMKQSSATISIEGNCDERGSAEYNLALGERRSKAAQQYLVTLGVKADRLSVISFGKEKPAVQGSDESAWAKNRRDEFVVVTP